LVISVYFDKEPVELMITKSNFLSLPNDEVLWTEFATRNTARKCRCLEKLELLQTQPTPNTIDLTEEPPTYPTEATQILKSIDFQLLITSSKLDLDIEFVRNLLDTIVPENMDEINVPATSLPSESHHVAIIQSRNPELLELICNKLANIKEIDEVARRWFHGDSYVSKISKWLNIAQTSKIFHFGDIHHAVEILIDKAKLQVNNIVTNRETDKKPWAKINLHH